MIFSTPFMFEAHIQVISDILISKNGIIGTQRDINDKQAVKMYYASVD